MWGRTSFGSGPDKVKEVTPSEAQAMLEGGQAVLIDVREPSEYTEVRAVGAKLIPLGNFRERIKELPTDQDVLLICRSGARSANAAEAAMQAGLTRVYNVRGGTLAWMMNQLPVERG
jgi:rhodanese-related sulfurtransferase